MGSLYSLDGTNGFVLKGIDAGDESGASVSAAGDVNGDGIDDILIGASLANPNGVRSGETYVVFGTSTGFAWSLDLSDLDGTNGFVVNGASRLTLSGEAVSAAGDVNDDGIDDILIGAEFASPNGNFSGETYVVFGTSSGFGATFDLSSLNGTNGFVLLGSDPSDLAGHAISSAGDVNDDGIDDILVGAYGTDVGGTTYVVFGTSSGFSSSLQLSDLNGTNGFALNGIQPGVHSGFAVSSVGDVNDDGIDDILIGAEYAAPNGGRSGQSYVVFGTSTGFASSLDLSSLNGTNGFALNGIDVDDFSGNAVSSAGDVNDDGIDDILIGAFSADPNGSASGETYVVFGASSGFASSLELSSLDGTNGFVVNGVGNLDVSGISVSSAGDVNGDDIDDILIGAYQSSPNGEFSGETYVVFGTSSGFASSLDLSDLDGRNGFSLAGIAAVDRSGSSVSSAGDVNGDDIDDILIGAPFADANGSDSGESYVVFGSTALGGENVAPVATDDVFLVRSSDPTFNPLGPDGGGIDSDANFDALTIVSINDTAVVSGDAVDVGEGIEVVLGADGKLSARSNALPGTTISTSFTYTISDGRGGTDTATVSLALTTNSITLGYPSDNVFILNGVGGTDQSGYSVSDAGDINGDGIADVLVGAPYGDANGQDSGETYVVFGTSSGLASSLDLSNLNGTNGFVLNGITEQDDSGHSVSSAGDVNGDDIDDILIGAPSADPTGESSGQTYVVFGTTAGFASSIDLSGLDGTNGFSLNGIVEYDSSGGSVSSAGDVNGDDIDDILIGARAADSNGETYVVFGTSSGFASSLDLSGLNGTNGYIIKGVDLYDDSGGSVSSAGDVNGDDIDDILIGARYAAPGGRERSGEAYVVFGSSSGHSANLELSSLDGTNGFQVNGVSAFDESGISVSAAGDVNGDGLDDIVIGAIGASPHGNYGGESYVVFGSSSGFGSSLDLSSLDGSNGFAISGSNSFAQSGYAVSAAGDINNDGIDDILIGAPFTDATGDDSGETYLVFGSSTGFGASLDLSSLDGRNGVIISGIDGSDHSGYSVSAAGDFDDDGIDDFLIGAPYASPNGNSSGETYVVFGYSADVTGPTVEADQSFSYVENRAAGTALGTVSASDDAAVASFAITAGNDDGWFAIDESGEITLTEAGSSALANDFETTPNAFTLTVEATDTSGNTGSADVTLTVTDIDDTDPVVTADQSFSYAENQASGAALGTVLASDNVAVATFAITAGNADAWFAIDESGEITLTEAGSTALANDFETTPNAFTLTVEATDTSGNTGSADVTLTVTDLDDTDPVVTADQSFSYAENQASGAALGTVLASDNAAVATFAITTGNSDAWFAIDSGGEITLTEAGSSALANDFETTPNAFTLTVEATDTSGNTGSADVSLTVTDLDDTHPVVTADQSFSYAENQASGAALGTVLASDNVAVATFAITAGNDDGWFAIDSSGEITLTEAASTTLANDYETTPNAFTLTVEVTDTSGNTGSADVTLTVTDLDDTDPVVTADQSFSNAENQASGAALGTVLASDNVAVASFAITAGNADAWFAIDESGEITLTEAGSSALANDYETTPNAFTLTVEATDTSGNTGSADVTLTVTDLDDTDPVVTADQSFSYAENQASGAALGTVLASDNAAIATFNITAGDPDDWFAIDSSGEITLTEAGSSALANDYETTPNAFTLTVEATDTSGNTGSADVTLTVTDLDDSGPVVTPGQSFSYAENQDAGAVLGTVAASDDVAVTAFAIVAGNDDGWFAIDETGEIILTEAGSTALANDYETTPNAFTLTVEATDDAGNTGSADVTLSVTSIYDPYPILEIGTQGADQSTGTAQPDVILALDGADSMAGGNGNDTIFGGNGEDALDGQTGDDLLLGRADDDVLSGGSGDDDLLGGSGDDQLDGGTGNDLLHGGQGFDTFTFVGDFGMDEILDFDADTDRIVMSGVTAEDVTVSQTFLTTTITVDDMNWISFARTPFGPSFTEESIDFI